MQATTMRTTMIMSFTAEQLSKRFATDRKVLITTTAMSCLVMLMVIEPLLEPEKETN